MIGRQIILRGWNLDGAPSFPEWCAEMGRVAAFEEVAGRRLGFGDLFFRKWGRYLAVLGGSRGRDEEREV